MNVPVLITSATNESTATNEVTFRFPVPFESSNGDQVSLSFLSMYYSWYNCTASFNNLSFSYVWTDGVTYPVNMPEGFYQVSDLNGYLHFQMKANNHYLVDANGNEVYYLNLSLNSVYYKVTLNAVAIPNSTLPTGYTNPGSVVLNGKVPQLVVSAANNWGNLIGFAPGSYPATLSTVATDFNSTVTPVISPVTQVNVGCNMVNFNKFQRNASIIHSFSPNVQYLSMIQFTPPNLLSYPICKDNYRTVTISFYDQSMKPLGLVDRTGIQVNLVLKLQKY